MITKQNKFKIAISWIIILKTIFILLLILIEIIHLIIALREESILVFYLTPCILLSTYVSIFDFFFDSVYICM